MKIEFMVYLYINKKRMITKHLENKYPGAFLLQEKERECYDGKLQSFLWV